MFKEPPSRLSGDIPAEHFDGRVMRARAQEFANRAGEPYLLCRTKGRGNYHFMLASRWEAAGLQQTNEIVDTFKPETADDRP